MEAFVSVISKHYKRIENNQTYKVQSVFHPILGMIWALAMNMKLVLYSIFGTSLLGCYFWSHKWVLSYSGSIQKWYHEETMSIWDESQVEHMFCKNLSNRSSKKVRNIRPMRKVCVNWKVRPREECLGSKHEIIWFLRKRERQFLFRNRFLVRTSVLINARGS